MGVPLPILPLATPGQRYSCHGCGSCCRDFSVQLRPADVQRLRSQQWNEELGLDPVVRFRGQSYLRQRADGSCVFLQENGHCLIHARHGFAEKPVACQMFPYALSPEPGQARLGVSFACGSVVANRGELLGGQVGEARAIALRGIPEALSSAPAPGLASGVRAQAGEVDALERSVVRLLAGADPLPLRLEGLAWLAQMLAAARLESVRGDRWGELLGILCGALPAELHAAPVHDATRKQRAMLRGAVFARTEDPKPLAEGAPTRAWATLGQLGRSMRWQRGSARALVPAIGGRWPQGARFGDVDAIGGACGAAGSADATAIDELVTRWLRARIEGGRAWGSGSYGWSAVDGLGAVVLAAACVGWCARWHAAGHHRRAVELEDVRAAVGRIDRTAGRAPWLGGRAERLRLGYLLRDDGMRRLMRGQWNAREAAGADG